MTMLWTALAAMLALAAGMLWLAWILRKGAFAEAEREQHKELLDALTDRKAVENDVDALDADAARKRLQQWTRG